MFPWHCNGWLWESIEYTTLVVCFLGHFDWWLWESIEEHFNNGMLLWQCISQLDVTTKSSPCMRSRLYVCLQPVTIVCLIPLVNSGDGIFLTKGGRKMRAFSPIILVLVCYWAESSSLPNPLFHVRIYGIVCASHNLSHPQCLTPFKYTLCSLRSYFQLLFELSLVWSRTVLSRV